MKSGIVADRAELASRRDNIRKEMSKNGFDAILVSSNVNLFYTCGRIVNGFLYMPADGDAILFVKRPDNVQGSDVEHIRKPEDIAGRLAGRGCRMPERLLLEAGAMPHTEYCRLANVFPSAECADGTELLRRVRAVKTPFEQQLLKRTGAVNSEIYRMIPALYRKGMTDLDLSAAIEYEERKRGDLGIFRCFGHKMEIFKGSLLAGENASAPSPYDFALGGRGLGEALPVGLSGETIKEGTTVMVDMAGNFFGYMGDMTRVFSVGRIAQKICDAHQVCLEIQDKVVSLAKPGAVCEELYDAALSIAVRHGLEEHFMGYYQHAGFVGHGVGIEINEYPVIAPRMKTELAVGMAFALEPKMVFPETGAVGIENTWIVTEHGLECMSDCPEHIIKID